MALAIFFGGARLSALERQSFKRTEVNHLRWDEMQLGIILES
jgi:hypothetical protein